jgi:hypothetical protein
LTPSYSKAVPNGDGAVAPSHVAWRVTLAGVAAGALLGCGASDRSALFGDSEPSRDLVVSAGGSTAMTPPAQQASSGGDPGFGMFPGLVSSNGGTPSTMPPFSAGGGPITGIMGTGGGGAPMLGPPPADPPPPADAGANAALPPLARCDFSGNWAIIIRIPVTWPEAPLVLHAGTGEVVQWNISHRLRDSALTYHELTMPCGIYLPDLTGSVLTNNQKFGIRFPNQMYDDGDIPPVVFSTTASAVGNDVSWSAGPVSLLTGLLMSDPANTPWPTSFPTNQTPDEDKDGALGVTVLPVDPMTDSSYNWPPVGLPAALGQDYPRAKRISVVVRSVANLHGSVSSCDEMRAGVDIVDIGGTAALNSMVIGCVKTTGETCSDSEASFVNSARPQFTPSGPGTLASVRIPDTAGCPDVRSRLPQ